MFTVDVPDIPMQDSPIVLAQSTISATPGVAQASGIQSSDYLLKACQEMPSVGDLTSAARLVDPAGYVAGYYYEHSKQKPDPASALTAILENPKHGKIVLLSDNVEWPLYRYDAEPGYQGNDQLIFQVQYHGKTYKVVVKLRVAAVDAFPENAPSLCPAPLLIKVNDKPATQKQSAITRGQ